MTLSAPNGECHWLVLGRISDARLQPTRRRSPGDLQLTRANDPVMWSSAIALIAAGRDRQLWGRVCAPTESFGFSNCDC